MSYRKSPDRYLETELHGEVVMMDADKGSFHAMKDTGLVIWNLLDEVDDVDSLVEELTRRYEVDAAQCRSEVAAFLSRLVAAGFVIES